MGVMLRTLLDYWLHKWIPFLLRYLLLQTTKTMRSANQEREQKHNRTQSIDITHKLGTMSRPASVMNETSTWKVANLSIAPHPEYEQENNQRVALLIFGCTLVTYISYWLRFAVSNFVTYSREAEITYTSRNIIRKRPCLNYKCHIWVA